MPVAACDNLLGSLSLTLPSAGEPLRLQPPPLYDSWLWRGPLLTPGRGSAALSSSTLPSTRLGRPNPFCCISVSSPMSRGWLGAHQAAGELLLSCICGRLLMEPQAASG